MLYANGVFKTRRVKGENDGFSLLEAAGYAKTISPGCISLLPFGVLVLQKIVGAVRTACARTGFWEVALPLLQRRALWEESGRAKKYPRLLCETTIGDKSFVINPTQEEAVLDIFRLCGFIAQDLPLRLFQVSERVRNEIRPAHGLIRSRCFTLADLYALGRNSSECENEARRIESVMDDVLQWSALPAKKGSYYPSAMNVPVYSYWTPSVTKQCIITVCCNCGNSYRVRSEMALCPGCSSTQFDLVEGVEIGDVMRSGAELSKVMGVSPANIDEPLSVAMAGIGVSRLLQLLAEYNHDDDGFTWPVKMAPFQFHIIGAQERSAEAHGLYASLQSAGSTCLLDLRQQSFGRLLVDADLIGIPVRIVFGNKTSSGTCEVKYRRTGKVSIVSIQDDIHNLLHRIGVLQQEEDST